MLVIAAVLIGCHIMPESRDPPQMSDSSAEYLEFVDEVLLAPDADCEPPCWQGLMPGVSTYAEVEAALGGISFVNQGSFSQREPSATDTGLINWSNTAPGGLSIGGQATFDGVGTLKSIQFTAIDDPLLSLGTIVDTFGEPDGYLIASSHDYSCKWARIIWPVEGLE